MLQLNVDNGLDESEKKQASLEAEYSGTSAALPYAPLQEVADMLPPSVWLRLSTSSEESTSAL